VIRTLIIIGLCSLCMLCGHHFKSDWVITTVYQLVGHCRVACEW